MRDELSSELLFRIKQSSSSFFEKLVLELILKMGYGGSRKEAGQTIGQSGDEGIDGIIYEDRLGLEIIYIQAKNGKALYLDQKSKNLLVLFKGKEQKKEYLLPPLHLQKKQEPM